MNTFRLINRCFRTCSLTVRNIAMSAGGSCSHPWDLSCNTNRKLIKRKLIHTLPPTTKNNAPQHTTPPKYKSYDLKSLESRPARDCVQCVNTLVTPNRSPPLLLSHPSPNCSHRLFQWIPFVSSNSEILELNCGNDMHPFQAQTTHCHLDSKESKEFVPKLIFQIHHLQQS